MEIKVDRKLKPWKSSKVRMEPKGMIRLPRRFRRLLNARTGDEVELIPAGDGQVLVRVRVLRVEMAELR